MEITDFILDDDDDDADEAGGSAGDKVESVTCKDYLLHFITFFWKFLFAFVPPTSETSSRTNFRMEGTELSVNRYGRWMGLFLCIDFDYWSVNSAYWRFSNTCKELIIHNVLFSSNDGFASLVALSVLRIQ
jgi:hypothetical protein